MNGLPTCTCTDDDYGSRGYTIHHWRTPGGDEEVDFALYGPRGIVAIEVKRSARIRPVDSKGLRRFREDYPSARAVLLHGGTRRWHESGVEIEPVAEVLGDLDGVLQGR